LKIRDLQRITTLAVRAKRLISQCEHRSPWATQQR